MQSPIIISGTSTSTNTAPATCEIQGWADLPGGLLQSIVALLDSFIDLLAFASTCRSWRAAFSSYPSKSRFCALLPPLLIRPNIPMRTSDGHEVRRCQVIDLANPKMDLCCQIPQEIWKGMHFAGSSYGQLICGLRKDCLIIDVFTGARVWTPPLPLNDDTFFYSGMLTAPLALQNSHLLVCIVCSQHSVPASLLDWSVGSDSWSEIHLSNSLIEHIVEFNGQFIAMDSYYRLYTLSLAPHLGLQEMITVWWDGNTHGCPFRRPWLVVCSGMLLIVDCCLCVTPSGAPVNYKAYRLDMSTEPATWVKVVKLENDALFIGGDVRSPPVSCMSPGRWGGRSNCLYYAHYKQPWVLHGLRDDVDAVWDSFTDPDLGFMRDWYIQLQPFWVYPSMLYSDGL